MPVRYSVNRWKNTDTKKEIGFVNGSDSMKEVSLKNESNRGG